MRSVSSILLPVDFSERSVPAARYARSLAAQFESQLILLHVLPPLHLEFGAQLTLLHVTLGAPEAAHEELERLHSFVHADAEVRVIAGDPPTAICAAAEGADLLAIGRGSAAGVFGRLRANAYSIIRQSPCPVVSI